MVIQIPLFLGITHCISIVNEILKEQKAKAAEIEKTVQAARIAEEAKPAEKAEAVEEKVGVAS